MRHALATVTDRGTALRLLLLLGDDLKKAVFPDLVELSSTGHSDIGLCRLVIKSLPRIWVVQHVQAEVDKLLVHLEDEESVRRFSELYRELDDRLLQSLVSRARENSNPAIREIADDFAPRQE